MKTHEIQFVILNQQQKLEARIKKIKGLFISIRHSKGKYRLKNKVQRRKSV